MKKKRLILGVPDLTEPASACRYAAALAALEEKAVSNTDPSRADRATSAAKVALLDEWRAATQAGASLPALINDVDATIEALSEFRRHACEAIVGRDVSAVAIDALAELMQRHALLDEPQTLKQVVEIMGSGHTASRYHEADRQLLMDKGEKFLARLAALREAAD